MHKFSVFKQKKKELYAYVIYKYDNDMKARGSALISGTIPEHS
jgi:hypothetical protein